MPTYRSKPKYVVAYQYDGDLMNQSGEYYAPDWVVEAFKSGYLTYKDAGELYIRGEIVDLHVHVGDYLILQNNGIITCGDKDEFESKYEYFEEEADHEFRRKYLDYKPTDTWKAVDWRTFVRHLGEGRYECKYLLGDDAVDDVFHVISTIIDMNQWKHTHTVDFIESEYDKDESMCTAPEVAVMIAQSLPTDIDKSEFTGTTEECQEYMNNFMTEVFSLKEG